ncbi:hypothetical protein IT6_03160 [Methylacidiphilum caldifontis]|uniref:hypothetical protein n=1 Tax=Methylacidiphilum caldifontis TaxID=2795386 RepID=UPI001A8DD9B2|nr:hypothetical protein [Methylacidiphilum caldifontis]QSR89296.1 hypothetical protein IT6_03160 [Methylacidiphilum caldifontis]
MPLNIVPALNNCCQGCLAEKEACPYGIRLSFLTFWISDRYKIELREKKFTEEFPKAITRFQEIRLV